MTPEEVKDARSYAWAYFTLHADQRMKLFNFFIILTGLLLSALSALRQVVPNDKIVAILPFLLTVTSFIFYRLEERTRRLVKNGEAALRFLDERWTLTPLPDKTPHYLQLIARDDHLREQQKTGWWYKYVVPISYADNFRIVYWLVGGGGLALTVWILGAPVTEL